MGDCQGCSTRSPPSRNVLTSYFLSHQKFADDAIEIRGRKEGLHVPTPQ